MRPPMRRPADATADEATADATADEATDYEATALDRRLAS